MAKELTDDELNLRRKARRRLIGAIALTLAVVVILPMVLESQPKPSGQDIELRIPAPDTVGEFVSGVVVSDAVVAPVLAESDVSVSAPAMNSEAVVGQAAIAKEIPVEVLNTQPVSTKTVESKASVAAPGRSADKSVSTGGYAAQIGAFSNASTAKQEMDKLKKWGFTKAYIEKVGDKTRVRVGPYAERDQAEKVRQMLEKHGLHPVLVTIK